jgi:hypothetical protein
MMKKDKKLKKKFLEIVQTYAEYGIDGLRIRITQKDFDYIDKHISKLIKIFNLDHDEIQSFFTAHNNYKHVMEFIEAMEDLLATTDLSGEENDKN